MMSEASETARSSPWTRRALVLWSVLAAPSCPSSTHAQAPAKVVKDLGPALPPTALYFGGAGFGSGVAFGSVLIGSPRRSPTEGPYRSEVSLDSIADRGVPWFAIVTRPATPCATTARGGQNVV